jgi:spermidine synthase
VLQVGGKIEGTSRDDLANTVLLAYLPLASHPAPRSFLTIGLGAGVTLGAARDHLRDVDLVEINPGVVEAIRRHGTPGLLDNLTVIRNDARNYLLATDKRYDVISSEPSYPTESAVANLFTRDFYEIAARRLNEGGVYCQWLPYYVLANDDVTMMLKTFATVFPHTWLWKVTNSLDLIMVGSKNPISLSAEEISAKVQRLNIHGYPLDFQLSRTPEQVREIASSGDVPVNTDDRPLLEYAVVDNMLRGKVDR